MEELATVVKLHENGHERPVADAYTVVDIWYVIDYCVWLGFCMVGFWLLPAHFPLLIVRFTPFSFSQLLFSPPFPSFSRCQWIMHAAGLTAMGLRANSTISSLSFYVTGLPPLGVAPRFILASIFTDVSVMPQSAVYLSVNTSGMQ